MIVSVIFERQCLLCGSLDLFSCRFGLCRRCFSRMMFGGHDNSCIRCAVCSRKLISEKRICMRCRRENFSFRSNHSFWDYDGDAKRMIGFYKFDGIRVLSRFFAVKLWHYIRKKYDPDTILLVPAPCSHARMKKFGFNHIEKIAGLVKRMYGIRIFTGLRRRRGLQLKKLDREHRKLELRGKLYMTAADTERFRRLAEGRTVIFLDDIFTTGTTASESAGILMEKGADTVDIITFALD